MRRLVSLFFALSLAACASTKAERGAANAPVPSDVAPITDGDVTTVTFNGMRIIVKRVPGAEFAAGQLYVLGGVRNWSAQDAGIESLAVHVATQGGTEKLAKDAFHRRLAALGSELGGRSTNDYSVFACKALLPAWDETFALLADTFLRPALPAPELEIARARQLAALRHEKEDPDAQLSLLTHRALFTGHPYERRAIGTLESVGAVKADQLAPYLARLRESSRLVLVVVGDVDPAHIIDQAKAAFGALPRGNYDGGALPAIHFEAAKLVAESRTLPTNYVEGSFPAPGWKDADLPAAMVAMAVLRQRLFEEVRTKRNLSYAPGAFLNPNGEAPTAALYVTAVEPNKTLTVMFDEARKLQQKLVPEKELLGNKSEFLSGLLMENETVDGQASLLARASIYGGDWHLAKTLPERIRSVSAADVQRFAQRYIGRLQMVVVGDPAKLDTALFQSL